MASKGLGRLLFSSRSMTIVLDVDTTERCLSIKRASVFTIPGQKLRINLQGEAKSMFLQVTSLGVCKNCQTYCGVVLKDAEATFIEFYCLTLIAALSSLYILWSLFLVCTIDCMFDQYAVGKHWFTQFSSHLLCCCWWGCCW